jgi:hypothetical protein
MKVSSRSSVRARLCGVAVLMAVVAGCGGGGGGGGGTPGPVPPGPPPGPPPAPEVRGWSKPFGSASVVLGQSGFTEDDPGSGTPLVTPQSAPAVTADGRLFVSASGLLNVFNNYGAGNGPVADATFRLLINGSRDSPRSLSIQGDKMAITSFGGFAYIYNTLPTSDAAPNVTVGNGHGCGPGFVRDPLSAHLTPADAPLGQRLILADTFNNRVLIWFNVPESGSVGVADRVLGQANMFTCEANDDGGDGTSDDKPSNKTLFQPFSVWSDGVKLVVADTGNNRVLVWNDIRDVVNFQPADSLIGQENFESAAPNAGQAAPSAATLSEPRSVDVSAAGELAVTDTGNGRVLIWTEIPSSDGDPSARFVVGRPDFTNVEALPLSAKSLSFPVGARFHDRTLIVNDETGNRVMIWRESD